MPTTEDPTLGAYLDEWLARRRGQLRPTTLRGYRQTVDSYLLPRLGERRLSALDRRSIERHYRHLLQAGGLHGKPLSPRTVRLAHAVLNMALKDARLDGLLEHNPAARARRPKHHPDDVEVDHELQVWVAEEARRFLDLTDDHPMRALWYLALGTGARRGELLGLRWQDVDLDAARIRVQRALTVVGGVPRLLGTKTSRSRTFSISESVVAALRRQHRDQQAQRESACEWDDRWDLVLTDDNGTHIKPMHVTVEFRRLVRGLDVPVIRFHDLRHTHASLLLAQGVQPKVVSERLGHTTIAMTLDVYGHMLPATDQDAAARLDAMLDPERDGPARW